MRHKWEGMGRNEAEIAPAGRQVAKGMLGIQEVLVSILSSKNKTKTKLE